ncbi:MAG TPA: hypothetical protein VHN99_07465, partial [Deinococcales bacterium]|nr:hypothetical protein [Deinococcales bacterium]
ARLLPLAVPLLLALYAGVLAAVRPALLSRTRLAPAAVLTFALALLMALLLGNKVFSPQYMAWLLPFAAFAPPVPLALVAAASAATAWIYPLNYGRLVKAEGWAVAALNLRNGLVLAALAAAVALLAREASRRDRSRPQAGQRA